MTTLNGMIPLLFSAFHRVMEGHVYVAQKLASIWNFSVGGLLRSARLSREDPTNTYSCALLDLNTT